MKLSATGYKTSTQVWVTLAQGVFLLNASGRSRELAVLAAGRISWLQSETSELKERGFIGGKFAFLPKLSEYPFLDGRFDH